LLETMNEDYVRTARAKGAPESLVLRKHILRNAMLPIVTMLGMDIGLALGGAVFTESIYSLPGLGRTSIQALNNYDTPTVMGVIVFRFAFRPMIVRQVTLLPDPDSPTIPSVRPFSIENVTPSTALTIPSSVLKYVFRSRTSSSAIDDPLREPDPRIDSRV